MAAVKLIKFVAVAILASSSAAEPTNRTCAGQDQDELVTLQVGEQRSHAGHCHCGDVCKAYNDCPGGTCKYSCSIAKESYLASNPAGLDQEAFSQAECEWKDMEKGLLLTTGNTNCWSKSGSDLTVYFQPPGWNPAGGDCPVGLLNLDGCRIAYDTSMNVICPTGWCECRGGGCGCKADGSCK
ncbi:unnamed protein product [Polarella glacialis]|uniref:Uncharacterized protein n=1 Tax=Polarella glacialis TaxID=89957 RepID=A0A813I8G7_POLGL|nr:unnamed protein product [Polarella glacialis]CAE8646098.1 unnamed protein product [Polarella glacialis]